MPGPGRTRRMLYRASERPGPGMRSPSPLAACESYAIMAPANGEKDKT
jgi:hypothetical protein